MPDTFADHLRRTTGSENTVEAYVRDAAEFERFLSGLPPSVPLLEEWVGSLNHGARKPQTMQRKLTAVRRWLGWRKVRLSDVDAASVLDTLRDYKVSPPVRQVDRREVRPLGEADFAKIRPHLRGAVGTLADFLWYSGCRISEAIGERRAGISPLTVLDGMLLTYTGFAQTSGKGGKRRLLVLPVVGRTALQNHLDTLLLKSLNCGLDGCLTHSELSGNSGEPKSVSGKPQNLMGLDIIQTKIATFLVAIRHVIGVGSQEEMTGIAARGIVARVEDTQSIGDGAAVRKFPRDAVSNPAGASMPYPPVTVIRSTIPLPQPAFAGVSDYNPIPKILSDKPTSSRITRHLDSIVPEFLSLLKSPLFASKSGRPILKQSVDRSFRRAAVRSKIRRQVSPHTLRHAYKARLRRAGVEAETIRRLMGHGPHDVTSRYGRPETEELLIAVERI